MPSRTSRASGSGAPPIAQKMQAPKEPRKNCARPVGAARLPSPRAGTPLAPLDGHGKPTQPGAGPRVPGGPGVHDALPAHGPADELTVEGPQDHARPPSA